MKKLLFIGILFLVISCSPENVYKENIFKIIVEDPAGNNLLDPDSKEENAIDKFDIKVDYIINNMRVGYYDSEPDGFISHSITYDFHGEKKRYMVSISLNTDENEVYPTTIVGWGNQDIPEDTIKAEYRRKGSSIFLERVWVNDEEVKNAYYLKVIQPI